MYSIIYGELIYWFYKKNNKYNQLFSFFINIVNNNENMKIEYQNNNEILIVFVKSNLEKICYCTHAQWELVGRHLGELS